MEPILVPSIPERLRTGFLSGMQTSFKLIKFVLPLYILVDLLKDTAAMLWLAGLFAPLMKYFGLPGEAAFAFIAAFLLNIYAAIAILAPLELTPWQLTQCGLMMGIAHNLILEGGVLGSIGTRGGFLTLCRLLIAAAAGLTLEVLHRFWGG
ncbi:nucleoside recognition domain-containing protein [Geoalkalibacter halelectricus]|uniref:Nucleoside transporter/FeoB GTPase Gate domain-containing protein n=1 Tax=Geoalkalibacter halelectricus TaxID=2847045 RepID=A0ABY5ZTZ1_9BACT|nr:nucleoside recognition domain-containing protein [Geoalkalibacter halelectricus]MDO3377566.1 hypothetical protein [Geoalkalibacter halelectricus]UWZ80676.1 hypothetical protein L9S41_04565 [Geoalkalibacter halelectricus]